MKKALSILAMIVALCLVAWVLAWGMALVTGAVLFSRTLDAVAALIHMPGCVESMVFWTFLAPFSILASRMFAPFRRARVRAFLLVVSVLGVYWTITYVVNQQQFFDSSGSSRKWADVAPDGHVTYFDSPGVNEKTGRLRVRVTPALLQKLGSDQGSPVRPKRVEPEKVDWFSPVTGMPVLYYVQGERYDGGWEFYTGAPEMFHQGTGELMKPVSHAIRTAWEDDMKLRREAAEKARLAAEEAAGQAKQQAEEQQRLAEAQQHQQELQAEAQQREAAEKAHREAEEKETARQVKQQAEEQQRLAEAQRQEDERLAKERQQIAAEKARLEVEATEAARQVKQQAEEQQRLAEAQRHEQERLAAAQEQIAAEKARLEAEAAPSWSSPVYPAPTVYVAPPVTYYYTTPVRYYYAVPRPPQSVRWVNPPVVRPQFIPMYRYAPVGGFGYRQQVRFGR